MDDDSGDGLGLPEPDVCERLAAVGALVHPFTERRTLPVVGLSRAHVDHVRVGRRDGDGPDGVGAVGIEHRLERRAVVGGLPQTAGGEADEEGVWVVGVHRDVVHSAALAHGADGAPAEHLQQRVVCGVDDFFFIIGVLGGGRDCGQGQEAEYEGGGAADIERAGHRVLLVGTVWFRFRGFSGLGRGMSSGGGPGCYLGVTPDQYRRVARTRVLR